MAKKGITSRSRNESGEARVKNGSTKVGSLRKIYGDEFAPGYRSDTKLSTLLKREHAGSLSDYRRHSR